MSDLLLIDGVISAGETVRPAVRWRAEPGGRTAPGWNLPLAGAVVLHLAFLVMALLAPQLGAVSEHPPQVYPIRLYNPAEVAAVSAALVSPEPGAPPVRRLPSGTPPVAEVQRAATLATAPVLEMAPAAAALVAEEMAPLAMAAKVAPAVAQGPPTTQPGGTGGLAADPGNGMAARVDLAPVAVAIAPVAIGGSGAVTSAPAVVPVVLAHPLYRENPPPEYPPLARRRQLEGTVVLETLVTPEGRVGGVAVHESSGHSLLDEAALKAVKGWRFEPGRRGAVVVAMQVLVPVRFGLR